jgi:hypothetical protein
MIGFLHLPARIVGAAVSMMLVSVFLTVILARHGFRRAFDVPRIPRPPAMFVVLGAIWAAATIGAAGAVATARILRDHVRVDGVTRVADVRCEVPQPGRVRLTVAWAENGRSETFDGNGDACSMEVQQLSLRAPLRALDVPAVAGIERVGTAPRVDGASTSPEFWRGRRVLQMLARDARVIPIVVPPEPGARFMLVSSPDRDPTLAPSQS